MPLAIQKALAFSNQLIAGTWEYYHVVFGLSVMILIWLINLSEARNVEIFGSEWMNVERAVGE